jgi:hypothetical protein
MFSLWAASVQFVVVSAGGLLVGLALSWPIARLHRVLDDALIEISMRRSYGVSFTNSTAARSTMLRHRPTSDSTAQSLPPNGRR